MTNTLQSVLTGIVCIGLFAVIQNFRDETTSSAAVNSSDDAQRIKSKELLFTGGASESGSHDISSLIEAGDFAGAKKRLLELAGLATDDGDQPMLARILSELGEVTLAQRDLAAAELYLAESLDVYEQLGDEVAAAGVYTLFGRLHLMERERAREASYAYDQLLIARWRISHDQFDQAEQALQQIVITNLDLNRFGAAASAYETLFTSYSKQQQFDKAELPCQTVVVWNSS